MQLKVFHLFIFFNSVFFWTSTNLQATDASPLSYEEALCRTFSWNYGLKIIETEIAIKDAEKRDVGRFINPDFQLVVKDFGGNKEFSGWKSGEIAYFITQLVETGSKRLSRVRIAAVSENLEYWNLEIEKRNLEHQVKEAFLDVVTAQENLRVLEEQSKLAGNTLECICTLMNLGKANAFEHKKALIEKSGTCLAFSKALQEFESAKKALVKLWGSSCVDFTTVCYPFYELPPPPCLEDLKPLLQENPLLVKQQIEILKAGQVVKLEKANAIPNVALTAGYKTEHHPNRHAFEVGVNFPIPIFNQNQDNICRAKLKSNQAAFSLCDIAAELESDLETALGKMQAAFEEVKIIRSEILPAVQESLELTQEGYNQGKFQHVDMLEAQRLALEAKEQYINALGNYHQLKADVEFLIGSFEN